MAGILSRGDEAAGENGARKVAVGEVGASGKDVPRCVGGACKGGVTGGEGRVCRESGAEGGGASGKGVAKGQVRAWEGGVVGGEGGRASCRGVAVIWVGSPSCAFGQGGEVVAKGGERLCRLAAPFFRGAACVGRRACSPFDLGCEG